MVSPKAVLVVSVVDCNFDRDRSINETNDSRGDADEVCVASVGGAGKSVNRQ